MIPAKTLTNIAPLVPPKWSTLRSIGNSAVMRLTIIFPLIGYLLLFNEHFLQYARLSDQFFQTSFGQGVSDTSWRLIFIYYGLTFLAVGSALYAIFCPKIIKKFDRSTDYIADMMPSMGDIVRMYIRERLQRYSYARSRVPYPRHEAYGDSIVDSHELQERQKSEDVYWRDILEVNYQTHDRTQLTIRVLTFFCYAAGFILLSIPSADVFFRVAIVARRTLLQVT